MSRALFSWEREAIERKAARRKPAMVIDRIATGDLVARSRDGWTADELARARLAGFIDRHADCAAAARGLTAEQLAIVDALAPEPQRFVLLTLGYCAIASRRELYQWSREQTLAQAAAWALPAPALAILLDAYNDALPRVEAAEARRKAAAAAEAERERRPR